jgi:hypothetical protein
MALEYVEISSRYTRKRDTLDRERLAHIKHLRRRRTHPKRHSTNKERSFEERTKHAKVVHRLKERKAARSAYLAAARRYWDGSADHP